MIILSPGTKICLHLILLSLFSGALLSGLNSRSASAQNATENLSESGNNTEGAIIEGNSNQSKVHLVTCLANNKTVPTMGIRFNAVNSTGDLNGWWNIPSSASGNNTGGEISSAKAENNKFELKGTMKYDFLCAQKDGLDYGITIKGKCNLESIIRFESSNEVLGHDFLGHVKCK
jgi:hypothetical protein